MGVCFGHLDLGSRTKDLKLDYDVVSINAVPGQEYGLRTFYFHPGQAFFVDYDAQIARGSLHIRIHYKSMLNWYSSYGKEVYKYILAQDGKGHLSYPIKTPGFYTIRFDRFRGPQDDSGPEVEMRYTINWGLEEAKATESNS